MKILQKSSKSISQVAGGLLVFRLDPLARHTIYDAVSTWVHVPENNRHCIQRQTNANNQPQPDVKNYWKVAVIGYSQVCTIVHLVLLCKEKINEMLIV